MTSSRAGEILRTMRDQEQAAMATRCFYCECAIYVRGQVTKRMRVLGHGHRDDDFTKDHIYPRVEIEAKMPLPAYWIRDNKVPCCRRCNAYKGRLSPLDWLVIMPSNSGAIRLAARLAELGCESGKIYAAIERRKP